MAAAGASTVDPALAYDTVSYEPIINVYETLVNYNGSDTTTYVPTAATCVPGTPQCVTDYGTNLTAHFNVGGTPEFYTFVIDPAAHFYDPGSHTAWSVYPSDVMFSMARTMAWTDVPYAGKTAGWILSQSLLQYGNPAYDGGLHFPFNNTPNNIYASMLVNDSTYCPPTAMDGIHGNGCVTFDASGSGQYWPYFMQLVADNLGASIVPASWFTAQGAGLPGWSCPHNDRGCPLPDGGTTTANPAWTSYLAGLDPTSWDSYEAADTLWPATIPAVQWTMVGSGPYVGGVVPGTGYQLAASGGYVQPSGCSGAAGFAQYTGYCDPAVGHYQHNVNVFWEPNDGFGISQYASGHADFAGIEAVHTSTLESLAASGKLYYFSFPTISDFFVPVNLAFNTGSYATNFPSQPTQTVSATAFSDVGLRNFYVDSYPYLTVENTLRTVDGIQFSFNSGGAIPYGMGDYYPTNVSFPGGDPYHATHDPDTNPTDVGGAAWWWAQINNPTSPYYDSYVATSCTPGTPCTWAIAGLSGDPTDDIGIADWISEIVSITGGALHPFGGSSFDLTFPQFLATAFGSPYDSPLVSEVGTGWAPDYPDPTDYVAPELQPDATYTASTTFYEQTNQPQYDNVGLCGHDAVTLANLDYWANAATNPGAGAFNSACQGVAYDVAVGYMTIAAGMPHSAQRVLYYNLIEQITNRLAMYVWNGQSAEIFSAAPWIGQSSINQNIMIGGGGDQIWFHIQYATPVYKTGLNFKETGLPLGSTWSVSVGSPPSLVTNTTTTHGGIATALVTNGTQSFSFTPPAGYGVAKVTGPHGTTFNTAPVTGVPAGTTVTVKFGPLENVYFNESIVPHWPGLPALTSWSITLTPANVNSPPGQVGSTTGTSIHFVLPQGANFKYQVSKPITYKATAGHGGFGVPNHTFAKLLKFAPYTANIVFVAHGIPAHTSWSVYINGTASYVLTNNTPSQKVALINGSYTWNVPPAHFTVATGPLTVLAPHGQTVSLTYHAGHANPSNVSRQAASLSGHTHLIAAPTGRE